ncbi:hypothetical protein [Actinoplanes auranticolor]|uniref:Uncharacterized protein n=1 Tax=Actinoplanes auranticolor TaxID=47988 RepID=A0A919SRJ2_9ACTN|nr:hypothetical protein [Actinoplanes auranticolor]GIM77131.1 hypothetical protein Aau02nite_74340 [Actinoplanes auranticolor]
MVLAGAELLARAEIYRAEAEETLRTQIPRADRQAARVTLSGLGADVIATGAAMEAEEFDGTGAGGELLY